MKRFLLAMMTVALISGCSTESDVATPSAATSPAVSSSAYLLADEPDGAIGVIEARESSKDGEEIIVVGQIGGSTQPWIEGRAAFTLLDASMSVVQEGEECSGEQVCMGDCCAAERVCCTTLVKFVDGAGQVVPVDARNLLGVHAEDTVVIRGKVKKDEKGNFLVVASGVYVRR